MALQVMGCITQELRLVQNVAFFPPTIGMPLVELLTKQYHHGEQFRSKIMDSKLNIVKMSVVLAVMLKTSRSILHKIHVYQH